MGLIKFVEYDETPRRKFIPVDDWKSETPEDNIFVSSKGVIEVNEISKIFGLPDHSPISFFIMSPKRCYASPTKINKNGQLSIGFKDHCVQYLNYFEKFYDTEKTLVGLYAQIKYLIEYQDEYNEENFINDLIRYFISYKGNPVLHYDIKRFVKDNYSVHLSYTNNKNPCLKYTDYHASILMEISFIQNIIIPLLMHFVYVKKYSTTEVKRIILRAFDLIFVEMNKKYHVDMGAKLFETILSNVNKNINNNKVLWDMQEIRARNSTTHSIDTEENVMIQILPKYTFSKNIICFNYDAIQLELKYKVIEAQYEYTLTSVSSSIRDEDNNSQTDKFEAHIAKTDEAMVIQTNVNCDQTMKKIISLYGPFDENEIKFYIYELTKGGKPIKNQFQVNLISYMFLKEFRDIQAVKLINNYNYVILMLAAKKYLMKMGQTLLPFIIGGRVEKLVSRKTVNKKILQKMQLSENYPKIIAKYQNKKIQEDIIFKIISQILASDFRNIDFEHSDLNGIKIQCIPEKLSEEILQYVLLI